jgi:hypothetical protein
LTQLLRPILRERTSNHMRGSQHRQFVFIWLVFRNSPVPTPALSVGLALHGHGGRRFGRVPFAS